MDGLLVIDKPGGITSRDAVDRVQRLLPRRTKVGHTGTLDPLATGVLVLAVGAATRLTEYVQQMGKVYRSRFRLGVRSTTDDADGEVEAVPGAEKPGREAVQAALAGFLGEIRQTPPAYSAAKVTGRRAYDLARKGESVVLAARAVRIDGIDLLAYAYPDLDVEIRCGKGTYVRSLARDLGELLGCGGMVAELRRTAVGPFRAEDGLPALAAADQVAVALRPVADALAGLPAVKVDAAAEAALRQGRGLPAAAGEYLAGQEVALFGPGNILIGVGVATGGKELRPFKILPMRSVD